MKTGELYKYLFTVITKVEIRYAGQADFFNQALNMFISAFKL